MKIAIYYRHRYGGVYRSILETQKRSRHQVDVVSDLPPPGEYDLVHSYSNSHGGEIHTAECNMCQALDYSKRLSRHAVKYFTKGLDELWRLRGYERVIAKSERDLGFLRKCGLDPVLIREGVDVDLFKPENVQGLRSNLGLEDRKVLFFAGRIEEAKGIILVLEAMPHLSDEWVLLVAGRKARGFESLVTSEEGRIRYLGHMAHEDLVGYYNLADVFCLPSWTECFPLTVLEALACGTPAVATDVGDIRKIIKPPLGGYLSDFNPRDLASKIVEAEKTVESGSCRELARAYTWNDTVDGIERIWEEHHRA